MSTRAALGEESMHYMHGLDLFWTAKFGSSRIAHQRQSLSALLAQLNYRHLNRWHAVRGDRWGRVMINRLFVYLSTDLCWRQKLVTFWIILIIWKNLRDTMWSSDKPHLTSNCAVTHKLGSACSLNQCLFLSLCNLCNICRYFRHMSSFSVKYKNTFFCVCIAYLVLLIWH